MTSMNGGNHYGTVEFVREEDKFLPSSRNEPRSRRQTTSWKFFAMGAMILVGLGLCVTVQTTLSTQNQMMATMQQQLEAMHATLVHNPPILSESRHVSSSSPSKLPHKLAVPFVTPLKTQDFRGTCWDFATIGVLEHSYRVQGIQNGWLQENEYVALSEQAYGAEILRLCQGPPDSLQHIACLLPGNMIWNNSTEGGESAELYYLMHGLSHAIAPHSICPYAPNPGNDSVCDGFTHEKRVSNPLKVKIHQLKTLYDEMDVKQALVKHQRAMALTTSMPYITHYYPCIGDIAASDPRCNPSNPHCTLCPMELSMSTCCIPLPNNENYNMNGEFLATRRGMTLEGGHVMTLVGFNDYYQTKQGFLGGFIVKNSWFDGIHPPLGPKHARGSHSIAYWMQQVSDWEERIMCPNSYSPYNWYQCGNTDAVIIGSDGDVSPSSSSSGVEPCLSKETQLFAKTNRQPLHLECLNAEFCIKDQKEMVYFVQNTTEWGDAMHVMCLFEYNRTSTNAVKLCLPPMRMENLAYIFSPIESEILENDPDACGFYFYPYEVERLYRSKFEGFYVNDFTIEWDRQSYVKNQESYPHLDYSDVIASTKIQHEYTFSGPIPDAQIVPKESRESL